MSTTVVQEVPELAAAWVTTRGGNAVIAVVDEGVDVDQHPEFQGRVALAYDARSNAGTGDGVRRSHGTKVAGLALGGGPHVVGLAPEATLVPAGVPALSTAVGDPSEADGLRWAADNGADVICCAWGPRKPTIASGALPARTRAALDYCLTHGRGGKGCIVVFAAGNDGND